jgi:hypothetical protein
MLFTNLARRDKKFFSWEHPGKKLSRLPVQRRFQRWNPADYGLNVTIAIVAKSAPNGDFVCATDSRLSFDDAVPAIDNAVKDTFLSAQWKVTFAAGDTSYIHSILVRTNDLLKERGGDQGYASLRRAICDGYTDVFKERVTREYLTKYGFASVEDFRKAGPSELGRKLFWSLSRKIDRFDLGAHLIVYGFDKANGNSSHMFDIVSPGRDTPLDHLSHFAVGTGVNMAMASLNLRPLNHLTLGGLGRRLINAHP